MTNERFTSVWDAIEDTPAEAENMKLRRTKGTPTYLPHDDRVESGPDADAGTCWWTIVMSGRERTFGSLGGGAIRKAIHRYLLPGENRVRVVNIRSPKK